MTIQGYPQISTSLLVKTVVSKPTPVTSTVPPTRDVTLLEVGRVGAVAIVFTYISGSKLEMNRAYPSSVTITSKRYLSRGTSVYLTVRLVAVAPDYITPANYLLFLDDLKLIVMAASILA